jgi:hypothetical protein
MGYRPLEEPLEKQCLECKTVFQTTHQRQLYCTKLCSYRAENRRRKDRLQKDRTCRFCSEPFIPTSANNQYCSDHCSTEGARRSRRAFARKRPEAIHRYYQTRVEKNGKDTLVNRVIRKYSLERKCESCGEGRVLDVAHRPEYKRNGAWRTMKNMQPHMIWVLCPTCHALIDRGVCTPDELGLS